VFTRRFELGGGETCTSTMDVHEYEYEDELLGGAFYGDASGRDERGRRRRERKSTMSSTRARQLRAGRWR